MLSVITFKWRSPQGYRSSFTGHNVNVLRSMVARNYKDPHRFICFTDDPEGIDAAKVEIRPLWDDYATVRNPTWPDGPSCYRRLKVFSRDFGDVVGPKFVCLDLDIVITRDVRPLWNRDEEFLVWKPGVDKVQMCASMFMLKSGSRPQVWEWFNPDKSPALSTNSGCRGSDQGWMAFVLGEGLPGWTKEDGVYSYPRQIANLGGLRNRPGGMSHIARIRARNGAPLPSNCRVAIFTGKPDPWDIEAQMLSPWITEHYR